MDERNAELASGMTRAGVERASRSLKGLDLLIRPIHHRTEQRVPAHIFLCLLAYYVECTCAGYGLHCCLRTSNSPSCAGNVTRFCPLAVPHPRKPRSSPIKPPTDYLYTVSPPYWPT